MEGCPPADLQKMMDEGRLTIGDFPKVEYYLQWIIGIPVFGRARMYWGEYGCMEKCEIQMGNNIVSVLSHELQHCQGYPDYVHMGEQVSMDYTPAQK